MLANYFLQHSSSTGLSCVNHVFKLNVIFWVNFLCNFQTRDFFCSFLGGIKKPVRVDKRPCSCMEIPKFSRIFNYMSAGQALYSSEWEKNTFYQQVLKLGLHQGVPLEHALWDVRGTQTVVIYLLGRSCNATVQEYMCHTSCVCTHYDFKWINTKVVKTYINIFK
jgi:hypothetical protein